MDGLKCGLIAMEDIKTKALQDHSEGRLVEAELSYRKLLEQSEDPDIAINLGALLRSQGRLQEASTHYHRCLERWSRQRNLILNACNCWKDTGESITGIHWLEHALKDSPDDTELGEALAEMLALAGKTAEAIRRYESIINANPSRIQSWMGLGLVHARLGQLKASATCYQKVLSINPKEPRAHRRFGAVKKMRLAP